MTAKDPKLVFWIERNLWKSSLWAVYPLWADSLGDYRLGLEILDIDLYSSGVESLRVYSLGVDSFQIHCPVRPIWDLDLYSLEVESLRF